MQSAYWSLFATCMILGIAWAWAIHEGGARGLQRLVALLRGIFWGVALYVITGSVFAIGHLLLKGI